MKVYTPEIDYKLHEILATAKLYKKQVTPQKIGFNAKLSKQFKQQYPENSLPALETETGKFIFGVHTILIYLSNTLKHPHKSQILQFLQQIQRSVSPATGIIFLSKQNSDIKISQEQFTKSKKVLSAFCKQLNDKLAQNSYLASEQITIADIACYFTIAEYFTLEQPDIQKQKQKYKNICRWRANLAVCLDA